MMPWRQCPKCGRIWRVAWIIGQNICKCPGCGAYTDDDDNLEDES